MTDERVSDKFHNLAGYVADKEHVERALQMLWKFDKTNDLALPGNTRWSKTG